jgi:hypothetical protein
MDPAPAAKPSPSEADPLVLRAIQGISDPSRHRPRRHSRSARSLGDPKLVVEVSSSDGRLLQTMPDVDFDPADGATYACCEAELARTAAAANRTTRFWGVDDSGRRLLLELPGV